MSDNPYSLLFGKLPSELISRTVEINRIIDDFNNKISPQQVYMITGVRGSGKTVLMTEISRKLLKNKNWVVVDLSTEKDMLEMLGASLSSEKQFAKLFQTAEINLSFFGFGLKVQGSVPITNIEIALTKMLEELKKKGKKVLVTIDEAINNQHMRTFISSFQILIRKELPIYLLMTGLYENIENIQNEKNLTFLYRAPKIELESLNYSAMAENYLSHLPVDEMKAREMARNTKGYSFAFQVLGYLSYENGGYTKKVLQQYKEYLGRYSYEKIWSELSGNDKKVCYQIAKSKDGSVREIKQLLGYETNQINPYRRRLIRKGIVNGKKYGYLSFTLPYFDEFVIDTYEIENSV